MKIKTLVKRALKNGFKAKPARGYKYLKDIPLGSLFKTDSGIKGILIEADTNAKVIITEHPHSSNDYELGKKIIAAQTEVKEIK